MFYCLAGFIQDYIRGSPLFMQCRMWNHETDSDSHCFKLVLPKKAACKCHRCKESTTVQRQNGRTETTSPSCRRELGVHTHTPLRQSCQQLDTVWWCALIVEHTTVQQAHGSWQHKCSEGGAGAQSSSSSSKLDGEQEKKREAQSTKNARQQKCSA